jgi:regulator of protease activity HflC (stomatin/prohibitin superfamily)
VGPACHRRGGHQTHVLQHRRLEASDHSVGDETNLRQEFGDLTLDESLVARETIAINLQRVLNASATEWGLTVSKVEIRLIDPPEDIKKAMHKQKTAEQEQRSMRLLATGEFEASEQKKLATIQLAEGEREAVIQVAQGKAKAIHWETYQ